MQQTTPQPVGLKKALKKMGLSSKASMLELLSFDCQQQVPPMVCHAEVKGLAGLFLQNFLGELTEGGQATAQECLDRVVRPHTWRWDANVALRISSQDGNLMMGVVDIVHAFILVPHAFRPEILRLPPLVKTKQAKEKAASVPQLLKPVQLKFTEKATLKYRRRERGQRTELIYSAFVTMAEALTLLSAHDRPSGSTHADEASLSEIHAAVVRIRKILQTLWPDDFKLPNVSTGLHYRRAVALFGVSGLLNLCVEEMRHSRYKHQAHTLSGRESMVELLQLENFQQAARHLRKVLESPEAAEAPEIKRLPLSIRSALLHPTSSDLRDLLAPKSFSNPYGAEREDATQFIRLGPCAGLVVLDDHALQCLARTVGLPMSNPVSSVRFVVLPGQTRDKGTISADVARHGHMHFQDAEGKIARVLHVLCVNEQPFVHVVWGISTRVDAVTGCTAYTFNSSAWYVSLLLFASVSCAFL
jgi:hypothetical protein